MTCTLSDVSDSVHVSSTVQSVSYENSYLFLTSKPHPQQTAQYTLQP